MICVLISKKKRSFFLLFVLLFSQAFAEAPTPKRGAFVDLLVWNASEETSSSWANVVTTPAFNSSIYDAQTIRFDWRYGIKTGFSYGFEGSPWDTTVSWTWFRTKARDSLPLNGEVMLPEFFGGYVYNNLINSSIALDGQVHWALLYNMFDWSIGRVICINDVFSLHPYLGLKGGWINQKIHSKWGNVRLKIPFGVYNATENLQNNFCGIGPNFGIDGQWMLCHYARQELKLCGDFSTALMWGQWAVTDNFTNVTVPGQVRVHMNDYQLGSLMFRGFLGFEWDVTGCWCWPEVTMQLGYEGQYWLSQLRLPTFQQLRLHGDLTIQGGVLRGRVDF